MFKKALAFFFALAAAVLTSCSEKQPQGYKGYLVVRGGVYDMATGKPLKGIRIVMASYNEDDINKLNPQLTDTTYTSEDGSYLATVNHIEHSDFYDIRAVDIDGSSEGGRYKDAQLKYIFWNGLENPLYGQDIYMEKIE